MADASVISAVISGVVSVIGSYLTYRVGIKTAKNGAQPLTPDDATLRKGEQAAEIVQTGLSRYGTDDEKADLANFERNPVRYESQFRQVIMDVATRSPAFMQQLESIATQLDLKPDVQGSVTVTDQATVNGNIAGVNQGTMSGTYHLNERNGS